MNPQDAPCRKAQRAARRRPKRPDRTGSIKYRGRIAYIGYKHNGKQVWESTKQTNEKVAERMLSEKLRTADTPEHVTAQADKVTFEDVAAVLLAEDRKKGLRTLDDVERKVNQLREAFGGPWRAITTKRVTQYQAECAARGEALATTNRRLAELRHMGRLAMRLTPPLITSVPYISLPDESGNIREGFVEPADMRVLLAELGKCGEPDVADAAEFAYATAWRREMVLGATWEHVEPELSDDGKDIVSARIRLPGQNVKNRKSHGIPLRGRALDVIRRRWAKRKGPHIFHRNGKRIRAFQGAWQKACEAAGRPGLLFHDLKRSAARNMRRTPGGTEHVIMKAAGWKTPSMFGRYDIVDDSDVAALFESMDDYVAKREKVKSLAGARAKRLVEVA